MKSFKSLMTVGISSIIFLAACGNDAAEDESAENGEVKVTAKRWNIPLLALNRVQG